MHTPPPAHDPRPTLYPRSALCRLLEPQTVAVYGATPRAGSFGERTLRHLSRFGGTVHAVNPKYRDIGGVPCYPSLRDLPQVPDCVFIVANRDAVEDMVQACADAGAGGAVIFAGGYAETGRDARKADQQRLRALSARTGVRLLGPNCLGFFDFTRGLCGSFSQIEMPAPSSHGVVGLVSQSGALGIAASQAVNHGLAMSHLLTAGNSCDVDVADLVNYLVEDATCQSIACIFEGMAEPLRMVQAARNAFARGKPLVVLKIATGEQGAQAARSHTGSLAGSDRAYRAALADAGAIVVDDHEALLESAAFFAKAGLARSRGTAVIVTSGGAGIMCADKGEKYGVPLPRPGADAARVLDAHVPEFGSTGNPCDVTAQVITHPASLAAVGNALLADAQYGCLVHSVVQAADYATPRLQALDAMGRAHGKPVCIVWLTGWLEGPGVREVAQLPMTALFHSTERCFAALAAWQRYSALRLAPPREAPAPTPVALIERSAVMLAQSPGTVLTERQAKQLLATYDVPVVEDALVGDGDAALQAAARIGYPVALKVESPDLPHKTEAGVVRLDLRSAQDVAAAFDAVMANARRVQPAPRIHGVLVQPMLRTGVEIMIGARIDAQFGPLVVVSLGGILVELLDDAVTALAPVSHAQALGMLAQLKAQALLDGFRGLPAVDRAQLARIIVQVAQFALDHRHAICEVDVNPLICDGARIVAVDALIVKSAR